MIGLVFNNTSLNSDLIRDGGNIQSGDDLETAALISLFTRGRALPDDVLPEPLADRGGYWGDQYADVEGDLIGSRLWLLSRSKTTQAVVNQASVYARECLLWMVEDGVTESVVAEAERRAEGVLAFKVQIEQPINVAARWARVWTARLSDL